MCRGQCFVTARQCCEGKVVPAAHKGRCRCGRAVGIVNRHQGKKVPGKRRSRGDCVFVLQFCGLRRQYGVATHVSSWSATITQTSKTGHAHTHTGKKKRRHGGAFSSTHTKTRISTLLHTSRHAHTDTQAMRMCLLYKQNTAVSTTKQTKKRTEMWASAKPTISCEPNKCLARLGW